MSVKMRGQNFGCYLDAGMKDAMINDFEIHDIFVDDFTSNQTSNGFMVPDIMSLDVHEIDSFFKQTFYTDIARDKNETSLSSNLSNLKNDNIFSSTELSLAQNNTSTTDKNYLSVLKEVLNETKTKYHYEMQTSKQLFENHAVNETDIFFMKGVGAELASKHKKAWGILKDKAKEESKEDGTATDEQMSTGHQNNLLDNKRKQPNKCYHLWDFLREILSKNIYPASECAEWVNENECEFRIIDTKQLSMLWGKKKHSKTTMTYDKLSRTLRYYCSLDILTKVPGKRLHFKFSKGKMWTKTFKRKTKVKKSRM